MNDYTEKISENPNFIDFNMIESSKDANNKDDILNQGDALLEKIEKEKDFPSLNGLEAQYSLVKFQFDPSVEKKFPSICKVTGPGH